MRLYRLSKERMDEVERHFDLKASICMKRHQKIENQKKMRYIAYYFDGVKKPKHISLKANIENEMKLNPIGKI